MQCLASVIMFYHWSINLGEISVLGFLMERPPGYRFTKGLTQNLNLRTNLKLKYKIKSLNYIQPNFRFQASFLYYWTMSKTFLHGQWFKSFYSILQYVI